MKYASLFERLIANSEKPDDQNENGCWLWTGNSHTKGYGRVTVRVPGKPSPTGKMAHRVMAEEMRRVQGDLNFDDSVGNWFDAVSDDFDVVPLDPDDETIEHLCFTVGCINPDHQKIVTRSENTALMRNRGG